MSNLDDVYEPEHTESSLLNFLRYDPKDRNNLDHDLNNDVRHSCRRLDVYVRLKPLEKEFHAAKQLDKNILGSANVLHSLRDA